MKLSILIIDDESKPARLLRDLLQNYYPEVEKIEICNSPKSAFLQLKEHCFDLVFMDVEMPEMDGFALLDTFSLENKSAVIFTTAHEKYAAKAFQVDALDYLLKPISPSDLIKSVNKVIQLLDQRKKFNSPKISLYDGKQYHIVNLPDLIRVEADGSYCYFILRDGTKIHSSKRLKTYESLLEKQGFVRSHKSHMVNSRHVKSYSFVDGGLLHLSNSESIPFSTTKKSQLLESFDILVI